MDKELALRNLISNYTDVYGSVTLTDKSLSNPLLGLRDNENPHLFTGQAAMLILLNNLQTSIYFQKFYDNCHWHNQVTNVISDGKVVLGLYTRFPDPYRFLPGHHGISWDEMVGLCLKAVLLNQPEIINNMIDYGVKHNWAFIDEAPFTDPLPSINRLTEIWRKLVYVLKNDPKNSRKDHKEIDYLSRIRQPKERAFYRALSTKHTPGIADLLFLYKGIVTSSFGDKNDTSTKIISFYKIKALDMVGHDNFVYRLIKQFFLSKLKSVYGKYPLEELYKIYFKDGNHPFHSLAKGIV